MKIYENKMTNKNTDGMGEDAIKDYLTSEEQLAQLVAILLNENAQHLNAVTLQRLSEARNMAVSKLVVSHGITRRGNVLQIVGHSFSNYFEHHRIMATVILVVAMVLTFFAAQRLNVENNLENSDAFLLASELPPEAFVDKGFDTWLVSKRD